MKISTINNKFSIQATPLQLKVAVCSISTGSPTLALGGGN